MLDNLNIQQFYTLYQLGFGSNGSKIIWKYTNRHMWNLISIIMNYAFILFTM